jgi:hypothetical protein
MAGWLHSEEVKPAVALTNAGYRVIATSRAAAPDEVRDGIRMVRCDVTTGKSVAAAVSLAHAELEHSGLERSDFVQLAHQRRGGTPH